jgi:pimeloyl-ACP methyl ester carboxylesterase
MSRIYRSKAGQVAVEAKYRALLQRWPVAREELYVETREGRTFVIACGPIDGRPLLLLHGSGANSALWLADVAAFAAQFRVYAVDLIGEPGLSASSRPPLSSAAYVHWLDDVLSALELGSVSIIGVSLGGFIALQYAAHRSERINHLIALSPSGVGRQRRSFIVKAVALSVLGRWGKRKLWRLVAGSGGHLNADAVQLLSLIGKHFRRRLDAVPLLSDEQLRDLTMPALVIAGGRDVLLDSYDTQARLGRHAPTVTVRLLPDAPHVLPVAAGELISFLDGSTAPAATH